jgi:hypothetical protein
VDTNNFHVILLGDINAPGFNWESRSPLPHCHSYSKGDAKYTSAHLLGLRQCVKVLTAINLLDLVFANFTDLKSVPTNFGVVTPDTYHPPFEY